MTVARLTSSENYFTNIQEDKKLFTINTKCRFYKVWGGGGGDCNKGWKRLQLGKMEYLIEHVLKEIK